MRIACLMMQKDESVLLDSWIKFHGSMFGMDSLFVFDNGSTDQRTIDVLKRYESQGLRVDWSRSQKKDFATKHDIFANLIRELDAKAGFDFYFPLDCDEFIGVQISPDEFSFKKEDIENSLAPFRDEKRALKVSRQLANCLGRDGHFRNWVYLKTAFARNSCIRIAHGYHTAITVVDGGVDIPIVYAHFHYRPYDQLIAASKRKLDGNGIDYSSRAARDEILEKKRTSWHLAKYLDMSEIEYYSQFYGGNNFYCASLIDQFSAHGVEIPYAGFVLPEKVLCVIDLINEKEIKGWAVLCAPRDARASFKLRLRLNDALEVDVVTNIERPDVKRAGHASPTPGFRIDLSALAVEGPVKFGVLYEANDLGVEVRDRSGTIKGGQRPRGPSADHLQSQPQSA